MALLDPPMMTILEKRTGTSLYLVIRSTICLDAQFLRTLVERLFICGSISSLPLYTYATMYKYL